MAITHFSRFFETQVLNSLKNYDANEKIGGNHWFLVIALFIYLFNDYTQAVD